MTDVTVTTDPPKIAPPPTPPMSQPGGPQRSPTGDLIDPGQQSTKTDSSSTLAAKAPTDTTKEPPKSETPPTGAPEAYADFKAPEGFEIDKDAIAKATPIFKELNLTQDQAQRLVDFYAAANKEASEAPYKAWADTQKAWKEDCAKRFGKAIEEGGDIPTSFARVIDAHMPPTVAKNFRAALDLTGAGSHPDYIEGFRILSKLFAEGSSVKGDKPSPLGQTPTGNTNRPSVAQAMYPHLKSAAEGA